LDKPVVLPDTVCRTEIRTREQNSFMFIIRYIKYMQHSYPLIKPTPLKMLFLSHTIGFLNRQQTIASQLS